MKREYHIINGMNIPQFWFSEKADGYYSVYLFLVLNTDNT